MRMGGGLPVVPVYDLRSGNRPGGGNPRPLVLDLDDITPLRGLVDGSHGSRLFEPRMTVRTKRISGPCGASGQRRCARACSRVGGGITLLHGSSFCSEEWRV